MKNLKFREATTQDKKQLLQLLSDRQDESNQLHGGTQNLVFKEGSQIFDEMLSNDYCNMIVGGVNGRLIATLTIHLLPQVRSGGYVAIIEDVLVAPDYRRQGVGRQLMQFAIDKLKKIDKVKKIKLGTRKTESHLHKFYESLGFKFTSRRYKLTLK